MTDMELLDLPRQKVLSTNIASVAHHSESLTLIIKFMNGSIYKYSPVSTDGFQMLLAAESIGGFFHKHIKINKLISYFRLN